MTVPALTDAFVAELLSLSTSSAQADLLRARSLADEAGLTALLAHAEASARHDPLQARALTVLCESLASRFSISALAPHAIYLRAQTYVLRGDAYTAAELIETARGRYIDEGMTVEALRTDVGAMNTLTVLGRYQEALAVGNAALSQIGSAMDGADQETAAALALIRAKIYVNQGPALSEMGQFDEAIAAYIRAESTYEALGMTDDRVLVLSNRGVALRYLGRVDEALDAYTQAASLLPGSGYLYALMQNNIGDAYLLLGDYQASLAALTEARSAFADQEAEHDLHICNSHMADAYLALNLYPEALALYQYAVASLEGSEYRYYLGKALWGMGAIHVALSQTDEAAIALARAAALFTELDNVPIAAQIILEESALYDAQGDRSTALSTAQGAFDMLGDAETTRWPVQRIYAHLRLADLLLPDLTAAMQHLKQADGLLGHVTLPHLRYRVLQRLGQLRRLAGQDNEAQRFFEAAIDVIERLRGSLADEAMLISFQQDKMAAYEGLIQLHLERIAAGQPDDGAIRIVFDLVERAKSRALVERISGIVQTEASEESDSGTLDRLQRLQASLNAIYSDMLGHDIGSPDDQETRGDRSTRMFQLSRRAAKLEQELTRLRLHLAAHARPAKPFEQPLPLHEIQTALPPDLKIVSYHIVDDEILAFVITRNTIHSVRRVGTKSTVQEQLRLLASLWSHLRAGSAFMERHMDRLEQNARSPLQRLYQDLLAPLEPLLDPGGNLPLQKLVIIPQGLLHQVPFQALYDGERYLIERAELSYAPSATVLSFCQQRQPRSSSHLLVLGVSDPAIPAVEAETQAITQALPQADVYLNEEASLASLAANVTSCRALHLACHGLFRRDNPLFSALRLYDGWLTAAESAQLDLSGALVVLSACESGRGAVLAGDETIGLTRAFLGAGATSLVVSQWLVQDDTGAMLMAEWYERLARGRDLAAALRAAQLSLKSSHPHPYHWAPFVLIGSRAAVFDG